ncbi:epimerase [Enterococcus florum]|uniref:Epimerase n=1 Tax=Enterococcus florum TaxID=2480627 RepID=A0A4P5PAE8_9ENTE|nr:NmrA family NAD(P)-binding protein [Enterococcus florum]GCF95067.1 epimerase [Enterococcus florum]
MILVTAAAGNVGRQIVHYLVERGLSVRAFDISPAVAKLEAAETMIGDARSIEDVRKALNGCTQVLYIPPMFVYDEAKIAQKFIDEAANLGIEQFVITTVTHPNMDTLPQHTQKLHAETHLVYKGLSAGLNYTILQPMHYMHNFSVPMVWETNAYQCFYTKTTKLSYVDVRDVAEVAATVLTESGHENATYELVGTDFLSPMDMVETFNQITGRSATCQQIPVDQIINYFETAKYDSYFVETFKALAKTYGDYGIAGNSNVLSWLLGRKPTSFTQYIQREIEVHQLD